MTEADALVGAVLVAWLASGLAAVALTPRNRAARSLVLAGVLLGVSALAESLAGSAGDDVAFTVLRTVYWTTFLGALAAVVSTLSLLPDGLPDGRWPPRLVRVLAVLAAAAPLLELAGSPTLRLDADGAARTNPFAVGGLEWCGEVGAVIRSTEPTWVLLGVAVLLLRWRRGDAERRRELTWSLRSIGLLAVLLVLVVASDAWGTALPPDEVFVPAFLLGLALFPVSLLVGITQRVRALEGRLQESRARLVEAEDTARRRLERDLHDGVQQQLVAALSMVALADRQLPDRPRRARDTVREVGERVQGAMTELRELVRGLRPPVLADAGLVAAVESRLADLPARVELHTRHGPDARCAPVVEAAAYFVVTEAVTNALKHAPGSRVVVRIDVDAGQLRLQVADDGPGLPEGASAGQGLRGLRDRVESLHGTFSAGSAPGGGTLVRAVLPAGGR